jgi:hypothetical protein
MIPYFSVSTLLENETFDLAGGCASACEAALGAHRQ